MSVMAVLTNDIIVDSELSCTAIYQ